MDEQSRRVLEFDKVLAIIAKYVHWEPSAAIVKSLEPLNDPLDLAYRQQEVNEACCIADGAAAIGAGGLADVSEALKAAERGRRLQPEELLQVRMLAEASRKTGRYLREHLDDYPNLADRALGMGTFSELEQKISRVISSEGLIVDSASPRLRQLRSEINIVQGRIQSHLQGVLRSSDYSRMLQEQIITSRCDRYVIPVKAEYRSHFPGLVIDQSSSGATLFMEPWSVVDLGNQVRAAVLAERKEVEAILAELTELVGRCTMQLQRSFEELAWFDALMAVAAYARHQGAVLPEISEKGHLRLVEVRHPILVEKLGDKVVPVSLELSEANRTLVITGPNTGGKTVSLKTTGLAVLMAMCGLPLPGRAGTQIPFLDEVWADIGDEQSLLQNLSTFSAHLHQILRLLPAAGPRTLVLIDELGAGTDPAEGSALGKALLEFLHEHGTRTIVTTHLSELKVFASKTPGVNNAAVEFDSETLAPTYKVVMGIPGRSNALRIAERLGLPPEIQRRAREHLGEHHVEVEGLLDELDKEREAASALGTRLAGEFSLAEKLRSDYEERIAAIAGERDEILEKAHIEAKHFLDESRFRVHGLLRSVRDHLAALEKLRSRSQMEAQKAAKELADALLTSGDLEVFAELSPVASETLAKALREAAHLPNEVSDRSIEAAPGLQEANGEGDILAQAEAEEAESFALPFSVETPDTPQITRKRDILDVKAREAARIAEAELDHLLSRAQALVPGGTRAHQHVTAKNGRVALPPAAAAAQAASKPKTPEVLPPIAAGSHVYVTRYGQDGTVLSISGDKAEVQVGVIRIKVKLGELEPLKPAASEIGQLPPSKVATLSARLDLHGKTVDEALHELSYRIDEAFMGHMPKLEIIHGKGTGILRKAIREYVAEHPMVASFRYGEVYEGGIGVTVIELKH